MKKDEYLQLQKVQEFNQWIAKRMDTPNSFFHTYYLKKEKREWKCSSIYNAYENYSWPFKYTNEYNLVFSGSSYKESEKVLYELAIKLKNGVAENNSKSCKEVCHQILEWGGVTKGNVDRIEKMGQEFSEYLSGIKVLLERNLDSDQYYKKGIVMNSGFTKIYSLLVDDFIIYDGRVGAALCLLVKEFCKEMKLEEVPKELKFSWGAGRESNSNEIGGSRRNPSNEKYVFQSINSPKVHLENNIRANWLVQEIISKTKSKFSIFEKENRMRAFEAAMFMIGYHVKDYSVIMSNDHILNEKFNDNNVENNNKYVLMNTLGGKGKTFWWMIDDKGSIFINRQFKNHQDLKEAVINKKILESLHEYVKSNTYVLLANDVKKLGDNSEKEGLGTFLCDSFSWNPSSAQIVSQISAIFCKSGVWNHNGKKRGIQFSHKEKEWEKIIMQFYLECKEEK